MVIEYEKDYLEELYNDGKCTNKKYRFQKPVVTKYQKRIDTLMAATRIEDLFVFNSPHFHAWYGDYKVIVNIKDGIVKGEMPGRALRMILEWLEDHRAELMNNWEKAQKGEPLDKIDPLK